MNGIEMLAIVDELQQKNVEQIIYFGSISEFALLSKALRARELSPILLGSAELLGGGATQAEGFNEVYLASSVGIPDVTSQGMSDYLRLTEQSGISSTRNPFLLNAYVGAKVLTEVLKQNGRTLSRASFVRVLESITQFNTGVGPTLRFSDKQHRGTNAVTIMTFDPKTGNLIAQTPFRAAH